MKKSERVKEIIEELKSFNKVYYHKSELLDEMFALQKEIVELTFSDSHASTANLKIWDVEDHMEQLNKNCGGVANEELARFKQGSRRLCNLIKAEVSGNKGERKAFKNLEYLNSENRIIKNIEFKDGDVCTELDAVVITTKCITIVEVKNTAKNIFIDKEGNYYRTGEFLKFDSNIADKMNTKERLLRNVLENARFGWVRIRKIIVFTNNQIEVHNKFPQLETCFLSQLHYMIDDYTSENILNVEQLDVVQNIIQKAKCREAYQFKFDVNQYKVDFANLMATLECANNQIDEESDNKCIEENIEIFKNPTANLIDRLKIMEVVKENLISRKFKYVKIASITLAISLVFKFIANNLIEKGGV